MEYKEISKLAILSAKKIVVQTILVNGVQQDIYADAVTMSCPICGHVIQKFQPGIEMLDVLKELSTDDETKLNKHIYCIECGQKIHIYRPGVYINHE